MQVIEIFDHGVMLAGDGPFMVTPEGEVSLTYNEAYELSHRIAASLAELGVGQETKVGVFSPNDAVAFCCALGLLRLNASWVPLNTRATHDDLTHTLELSDCEVVFFHPSLEERARALADAVPSLRELVPIAELDNWMAPPGTRVPQPADAPEAVAVLAGSGGTTGKSKGVLLSHRAIETMNLIWVAHMPEDEPPVNLLAAPMTHAAGITCFPVFAVGGVTVVHEGVNPEEMLTSIERNKVTRMFLPPTAIYSLLDHPTVRERDYSSLRYFIYAAAPMSTEKLKEAMEVFGPVMTQTFGQSEAPMICTYFGPEDHKRCLDDPALEQRLASCGRPALGVGLEVMDDDGNILPPGERGEIVVRGSLLMNGYYKNQEETEAASRNGWHCTSDIGYKDEDGFVYIVDRKRDMIITGGFNVYPGEIEQVVWGHPAVNDCAVIGLPDDKWGESVTAVVEPKSGEEIDPDELIKFCRERLSAVKTPKTVIVRELPRSPVGKVLKKDLRQEYWAGHERAV
jgi:acyl-CoA synthetase (AMP-forming)/AMP-acid ligase II